MGTVLAVANQKGGVGKTTTAVNLASCLAVAERNVLLIDVDPQANATSGLGVDSRELDVSVYDGFVNRVDAERVTVSTKVPNLSLLPSHINLVGTEVELVQVIAREKILREALSGIRDRYDYVLIDCPPSLGILTLNALTAADSVLIPIQCEYYALEGLSKLLNTVKLVQKNLNKSLGIFGVLMTMYDGRLNLCQQVEREVRDYFKEKVFQTAVMRNVRLSEAPSFGLPIIMFDAASTGADNYMRLAEEILSRESVVQ